MRLVDRGRYQAFLFLQAIPTARNNVARKTAPKSPAKMSEACGSRSVAFTTSGMVETKPQNKAAGTLKIANRRKATPENRSHFHRLRGSLLAASVETWRSQATYECRVANSSGEFEVC